MKADSKSGTSSPLGSILRALGANLGIAVAKTVTAVMTGSGAMLAESIHSYADCANQLLLLLGLKEAKAPESEEHPLGHGRVMYFYSLLVGMMLLLVGGAFSIYKGFEHFMHPEHLKTDEIIYAIGVLVLSICLEGYALKGALQHIKKERKGKSLFRWFRETRSSEMLIVAGEDIAAITGLLIALASLGLAWGTGDARWDAVGSMGVGILLVLVAIFVIGEIKSLIVGESASPEKVKAMKEFVESSKEIKTLYRLITLQWGSRVLVLIQAEMHKTGSEIGLVDATNRVENRLKEAFPEIKYIFFEPDRNREVHEYEDEDDEKEPEQEELKAIA